MHKRNKAKNKHKNPNPTPPQQRKDEVKINEDPTQEEQSKIEEKEDRVPEIVPKVQVATDVEEPVVQIPAKPKRHRAGKKRKQNEKDDNESSEGVTKELSNVIENKVEPVELKAGEKEEQNTDITKSTESRVELQSELKEEIKDANKEPNQPAGDSKEVTPAARKKKGKQNKNETGKSNEALKESVTNLRENVANENDSETPCSHVDNITKLIQEPKEIQPNFELSGNDKKSAKKKNKKNSKELLDYSVSEESPILEKADKSIEKCLSQEATLNKEEYVHNIATKEMTVPGNTQQCKDKTKSQEQKEISHKPVVAEYMQSTKVIEPTKSTAINTIKPESEVEESSEYLSKKDVIIPVKPQKNKNKMKTIIYEPNVIQETATPETTPIIKEEDSAKDETLPTTNIKLQLINEVQDERKDCKSKNKYKKDKKSPQEPPGDKNINVIIDEQHSDLKTDQQTPKNIKTPRTDEISKDTLAEKSVITVVAEEEITMKPKSESELASPETTLTVSDSLFSVSQINPGTLLPLPEDDNNNIIGESIPVAEEIINTEFEKLLDVTLATEPIAPIEPIEVLQAVPEVIETDAVKFVPLSESNIDESYKKLFEALLVTDAPPIPKKTDHNLELSSENTTKEEEFIIRLFEKTITKDLPKVMEKTKESKPETTALKEKVMEVNKDMEDLKMSIEKSLAELTAMEADDMPELVAITDYEAPLSKDPKQEAIAVVNVESHIVPDINDAPAIVAQLPTPSREIYITSESELSIPDVSLKGIKREEVCIDSLSKKNKGKGKTSKLQDPVTSVIQQIKEEIPPSHNIKTAGEETQHSELEVVKQDMREINLTNVPLAEPQSCNPEPKGKGKGKNKKKNRTEQAIQQTTSVQGTQSHESTEAQESKTKIDRTKERSDGKECKEAAKDKAKDTDAAKDQEHVSPKEDINKSEDSVSDKVAPEFDMVENFEDALTTSMGEENLFEKITGESLSDSTSFVIPVEKEMFFEEPTDENVNENKPPEEKKIENPLTTRSKNFLGTPDFSVTSSKIDYKKERNKNPSTPNTKQARIKVKDSVEIENEKNKCSKQSQTENKMTSKRSDKSSSPDSDNEEYVYKYSFRKVFLTNSCNTCKVELKGRRLPCGYCNLVFYCSQKHKDEDWSQHQALCFAVSTLVHLKGQKFIYGDAAGATGQEYRLLRMQVIISCEKILKRKLLPCEQEILLYPRVCAESSCREWRTANLVDCGGCGLVSYCSENPQHLTKDHQLWCKSYRLYYKLVTHQQSRGRLEPKLPSKVVTDVGFGLPDKINELLAHLYEEKIDLDDIHYAALTQLATAPLTAAYGHQLYRNSLDYLSISNGHQDKTFTLHVVGAELQFEADTLNKWEVFFLHLRPEVEELKVVFVGPELNPSKLPLELLAKIKMCKQCRQDNRRILFEYQDGQLYHNYVVSKHFTRPDIVCAFNPGLHRSTGFGGLDSWPTTINSIMKQHVPFCITSYTKYELPKDLDRIRECSNHQYKIILEPMLNPYASIRPDRNFISDDEMPLIFKNYYLMVLAGV